MDVANAHNASGSEMEDRRPQHKLDLGYFTEAGRCPLMVRRGARSAFELFLHLAQRFFEGNGEPVPVEHEAMCCACGLQSDNPHSRSAISRLLRSLRATYQVIDYQPIQRRRPLIRLAPPRPDADILNPRHYVYFDEGWSGNRRAVFDVLGPRAFCSEYMLFVSKYESALARVKHGRAYWFFPLEKISKMYHVSTDFAGMGLRGLVQLGIMRVAYGQYGLRAPNNEFGLANRYYFKGIGAIARRQEQLADLERHYDQEFEVACVLAAKLTNGLTAKNVEGLCTLIAIHGETLVRQAIEQIAALPTRSLRRRLPYVRALVVGKDRTRLVEPP